MFARDAEDGRKLTASQIVEIERLLATHRDSMKLGQFEAHLSRPNHYKRVDRSSNDFAGFFDRLKWSGCENPRLSISFERLTKENPAYRLTREFVRLVFDEAVHVTPNEVSAWIDEATLDTWTYDYTPEPNETYDNFLQTEIQSLNQPDKIRLEVTSKMKLFEVEGLPALYLLEQTNQHDDSLSIDLRYFFDVGTAFVPTPLPEYYIL